MEKTFKRTFSENWDFRESDTKEFTHGYHNYPAMMIPQIARKLILEFAPSGKFDLIFDPYMGSGTTLVESKLLGVNSIGTDINPLARLIAKTKTTNFDITRLNEIKANLELEIESFDPNIEYSSFINITNPDFWYSKESITQLKFLTQLINQIDETNIDFFKLALSECVREVSYTRNGEFKRYRMEQEKMANFKPNTFKLFFDKLDRNIKGLKEFNDKSSQSNVIIESFNSVYNIPNDIIEDSNVDMIVTSPPYGDSKTTVAYCQFSRWANEWFGFENAKDLDKYLMGGKKITEHNLYVESISSELAQIKNIDLKRYLEVMDFLKDYNDSITNVSRKVRTGGIVCYVVGNRTVKGVKISLDYFTAECFEKNGFKHIDTFVRNIPNKRMPSKTSPNNKKGDNVSTMMNEYIVILEKN